jgi:hypothetical protein
MLCLGIQKGFGAAFTNDLIANYPFETNGDDIVRHSPSPNNSSASGYLSTSPFPNPPISNGVLCVNGPYMPNGIHSNYLSTAALSELRFEAFTLSLDFYPLPRSRKLTAFEQKLDVWTRGYYLRSIGYRGYFNCDNIITGGSSYRWFALNREDNQLNLTLNNQNYTHSFINTPIKPGRWHHVSCSIDLGKGTILTMLDGRVLETIILPPDFKLSVAESPYDASDRAFMFQNYSNGSIFHGYAAHLKIFERPLSLPELAALYRESLAARPPFPGSDRSIWWIVLIGVAAVALMLLFLCIRRRGGPTVLLDECDASAHSPATLKTDYD